MRLHEVDAQDERSPGVDLAPFGLAVGHATDADGATGLTVVRGVDAPLRAAAAVVGRATGTRELDALDPAHLVGRIDALVLTGGSAYGLEAAGGVMRWMEERGRGFDVGAGVVPIVPAAVIFDLAPLGRFDARPTPAMAYAAADAARAAGFAEGSVGVGTGATVGKGLGPAGAMKGGFGCALAGTPDGLAVAAMAAVNAFGDVRDAAGRILAGARAADGGFADTRALALAAATAAPRFLAGPAAAGHHTTLCVVAANRPLSRLALRQLATAATAALHRRITPTGTSFDGDVVFALSPMPMAGDTEAAPLELLAAEGLAVEALERAIERAVRLARGRDGIRGLADDAPPAPAPR
ncbi:MAG TPA: P1 family peptidase [Gemmatimonadaceae bacterium]|nr:P1 family peptidase [Gemmatimonadaceae bacterium]